MSRAEKKRRSTAATHAAAAITPDSDAATPPPGSRLQRARRRAGAAKALLGTGGALAFGAVMLFARVSYAGHPKRPPRPLAAPPRFVSIVSENLLQAGILAPAEASPDAATSVS